MPPDFAIPARLLGVDTFNGLLQGVKLLFEDKGHKGPWSPPGANDAESVQCRGNPADSDQVVKLRKLLQRMQADAGNLTMRASPLTAELVVAIAKKFVLIENPAVEDLQLHAICLLGLNCGMRWDELAKIPIDTLITSDGLQPSEFAIRHSTKKSIQPKRYGTV